MVIGNSSIDMTESTDRNTTMDTSVKYDAFRNVLKKMGAGETVAPELWKSFVAAQNDGLRTGPGIGEKVPDFTLPDQSGKAHSLHDLMGPKGLLLVFVRSADW
jgi:AhpC/TSA family